MYKLTKKDWQISENEVTNLSKNLFNWEIHNNIDSIDNLLHSQFDRVFQ